MAATHQLDSFNARLSRISDPSNTSYFDPEAGMNIPKRVSKQQIKRAAKGKSVVPGMFVALLVSAISMVCVSAGFLRIGLVDQWFPALTLMFSAFVSILICEVLKLNRLPHLVTQMVGVGAMMACVHNLVLLAPDAFSILYTPEFVAKLQATSELGSVVFLGQTVSF